VTIITTNKIIAPLAAQGLR